MHDFCVVCADTLEWVAYELCSQRDVCSTCVARLCFVMDNKKCCICKTVCPFIFVTKALMDARKQIEREMEPYKVSQSGHTVIRADHILILFGGEDAKWKKLHDLHKFDLKSLTWLPLNYKGTGPSPRSNHVAALYNDRVLLIFGGQSKSKTLNDIHALDFEIMVWSSVKTHGHRPSPRAGCCGALCGTKWYIAEGGSKKKRHPETWVFDVLESIWSVCVVLLSFSITTKKDPKKRSKMKQETVLIMWCIGILFPELLLLCSYVFTFLICFLFYILTEPHC